MKLRKVNCDGCSELLTNKKAFRQFKAKWKQFKINKIKSMNLTNSHLPNPKRLSLIKFINISALKMAMKMMMSERFSDLF